MKRYKHKITGDIIERLSYKQYYVVNYGQSIPKRFVENSCDWEEIKEPIFVTEDGVDVFEGDSIYTVSDNFQLLYTSFALKIDKTVRSFAEKENAEKYIEDNQKKFSLSDIREAIKYVLPDELGYKNWKEDCTKDFENYLNGEN